MAYDFDRLRIQVFRMREEIRALGETIDKMKSRQRPEQFNEVEEDPDRAAAASEIIDRRLTPDRRSRGNPRILYREPRRIADMDAKRVE